MKAKIKCPDCNKEIWVHIALESADEPGLKPEVYEMVKRATEEVTKRAKRDAFEDIFKMLEQQWEQKPMLKDSLEEYFSTLRERAVTTKDVKELKSLRDKVKRSKIRISSKLKKQFSKQKKVLIDIINTRVKRFEKEKKKKRKKKKKRR